MERYATISPEAGQKPSCVTDKLRCWLKKEGAKILRLDIFGPLSQFDAYIKSLREVCGQIEWPVTWIGSAPCSGADIAGIQVYAVSGFPVKTLLNSDKPVGRVFEDSFARYCAIGNIISDVRHNKRSEEVKQVLLKIENTLSLCGMDMSDVVRTWFYNDDIVSWYDEFNLARNSFFRDRNILNKVLPASTGVGGKNISGSALIASALAVKAKADGVAIREVASPVQGPATCYGSSFSRGLEVVTSDYRRLFISGTASIAGDGKTAHAGDVQAQVFFTMQAVESLLASCGMDYSDIKRAVVYFKDAQDAQELHRYFSAQKKPAIPLLVAQNDICRNDLLFEVELDAVSAR